jgi:RNA polymerase sigma factor (sigma-70 family)
MNDDEAANFREKLNNADYIARLKAGDEDALYEFSEWLYRKLPSHIARKFRQNIADAEDLASILVLHIRDRLDRFKEISHKGAFEDWMYKVVRNKVLDEIDKRKTADNKDLRELYELEIKIRDFINKNLPSYEDDILRVLEEASALRMLESKGQDEEEDVEPEDSVVEENDSLEKIEARRRFLSLSKSDKSILLIRAVAEYEDIARDDLAREGKLITEKNMKAKLNALYKRHERAMEHARALVLKKEESS